MTRLQAGNRFPNFTFSTNQKDNITISDILTKRTVFWVLRYIGCPVCRYDVHQIAMQYSEFQKRNTQVFVVMQSDKVHVNNDLQKTNEPLPFEIICDPDQSIYHRFSIDPAKSMADLAGNSLDKLKEKGEKAAQLGFTHGEYEGNEQQLPAMFIVEPNGVVSYAHYAENLMDMPTVDQLLSILDQK